jgi:hypothetical protein
MSDRFGEIDKTALSVLEEADAPSRRAYWQSKTPRQRLAALELMRQMHYDYDPGIAEKEPVMDRVDRASGTVRRIYPPE